MSFEVSKRRLLALLKAEATLEQLKDYGVEDWEYYKDAINDTYCSGVYAINNLSDDELLSKFKEIR